MAKSMFDPDALIAMFESATAQQGAQLRKAVSDATLAALQGRELSLKNIRTTLKSVADAAGAGAAKNILPNVDVQGLLDKAVSGMDDALLKAVDANRVALGKLVQQGADLREKHLKKALDDMEKFEDALMGTVRKAAESASGQLGAQWAPLLEKMQAGGTLSGTQATQTVEQLLGQMQTTVRDTRAASLRAAQALAESYTAMVSGVLIGMSDALQQGGVGRDVGKDAGKGKK